MSSIQLSLIARSKNIKDEINRGYRDFVDYDKTMLERHSHETNEFHLKLDIPSFNGDLSVGEFMDYLTNYDKVMEYLKLYGKEIGS